MTIEQHMLRVNIKSLAAESRYIRKETKLAKETDFKNRLSSHRTKRLRPEARKAQLALAFIKGMPYKKVEAKTNNPIDPKDLINKLRKFDIKDVDKEIIDWLNT